ncbi:MAG TPA: hypothetical protein VM914_00425 [Pyrinomonadaceae bacterium]|jgi:hypothetical protein|nr:hypothetical protein [Pyrinomonadaceae bacterium]
MPTRKFQTIVVDLEGRQSVRFAITPSAQDRINLDLRQAVMKGTISGGRESLIARQALTAAAIEKAIEDGTRWVTARHVKRGWLENLSLAGRVCIPARKCVMSSVVARVDEVKDRSAVFRQMIAELEDRERIV